MKLVACMLLCLAACSRSGAQTGDGKRCEIGLSGSFQSLSVGNSGNSSSAVTLSPRFGWFVTGGLEIEPEVLAFFAHDQEMVYVVNGNVAYNFVSLGQIVPFILMGYGQANMVPSFGTPAYKTGSAVDVLNFGIGVKFFPASVLGIRLEYRYQWYSGKDQTGYWRPGFMEYPGTLDVDLQVIQFGVSVMV